MEENHEKASYESEFDSRSLVQLLQRSPPNPPMQPTKKHCNSLAVSVIILYAIVGTLILHLTISSSLREAHLKTIVQTQFRNELPPREKYQLDEQKVSEYSIEMKSLQKDVARLELQIGFISNKLSQMLNKSYSEIDVNKTIYDYKLNSFQKSIEKMSNTTKMLKQMQEQIRKELDMETNSIEVMMKDFKAQILNKTVPNLIDNTCHKLFQKFKDSFLGNSSRNIKEKSKLDYFDSPILENSLMEPKVLMELMKNDVLRKMKSCQDYKQFGIATNGYYIINIERNLNKISLLQVYCDFTTDSTHINHNGSEWSNIKPCSTEACFEFQLSYAASMDQIKYLINSSISCEQNISFKCFHAHLKNYGAWYDVHGEKQVYFTGSNYGKHVCSCSNTTEGCSGIPSVNACNCDASLLPSWLEDSGSITNSSALPITKFTYGYLLPYGDQKGKIKIGPLVCKGRKQYDIMSDCEAQESAGLKILLNNNNYYMSNCDENQKKTYLNRIETKKAFLEFSESMQIAHDFTIRKNIIKFNKSGYYLFDCIHKYDLYDYLCDDEFGSKNIKYKKKGDIIQFSVINLEYYTFRIVLL